MDGIKICTKCGVEKPYADFYTRKDSKQGYSSHCKSCIRERNIGRSEEKRLYNKKYREDNTDRIKEQQSEYHLKNKEKRNSAHREYSRNNAEKMQKQNQQWKNTKYKTDPLYTLKYRIKCAIKRSFRKKGYSRKSSVAHILGCSYAEFLLHLESRFKDGMSWENRSEWHIDHIIPLASAKNEEDVIKLNHFTNLQPLWAKDNLQKGASMPDFLKGVI